MELRRSAASTTIVLGLVVAAAGLGASFPTTQASAGSNSALTIGSLTLNVGDQGSVDLEAINIDEPVGAWAMDILYDPDVVSIVECAPTERSTCNPERTRNSFRLAGASATGLAGGFSLASITLQCESEASSPLTIELEIWGDATGFSRAPSEIHDGTITCAEAPESTSTAEPAPTASTGPLLPVTGTGSSTAGGGLHLLIAALAGVGVAAIGGTALRSSATNDGGKTATRASPRDQARRTRTTAGRRQVISPRV